MYSSFDMPSTFKFPCTRKTPYDGNHDTTYLYNTYYQWVSIFLAFQAGLFYIPRCIWLIMEGGLMAFIVNGMTKKNYFIFHFLSRFQAKKSRLMSLFLFFFVDILNCLQTLSLCRNKRFMIDDIVQRNPSKLSWSMLTQTGAVCRPPFEFTILKIQS